MSRRLLLPQLVTLLLLAAACTAAGPAATSPVAPSPSPSTPAVTATASPTSSPSPTVAASPSVSAAPVPVTDIAQIDDIWWVFDARPDVLGPNTINLDAAGTWRLGHGPYPGQELGTGTFDLVDSVMTWHEGWFDCEADASGSYTLTLSADGRFLSFVPVEESCFERRNAFAMWRTWQRGKPPTP